MGPLLMVSRDATRRPTVNDLFAVKMLRTP